MRITSGACLRFIAGSVLVLASCDAPGERSDAEAVSAPTGRVAQMLDVDGDGMDDVWEIQNFGTTLQTQNGDFDSDGMTNGEEHAHGFNPTVADSLDDADGDRYPNIYEVKNGSNPKASTSTPTPSFVVDGTGAGTHLTVAAAVTAANVTSGDYQIIGIAPGTYTGSSNVTVTFSSSKPKFLVIGLQGADKTIFDGGGSSSGWIVQNTAVIASLTFRKSSRAFWVNAPSGEVRFVDVFAKENAATSFASGVHVASASKIQIVGSTFLSNTGSTSFGEQIYLGSATAVISNTVVWGGSSGPMLGGSATANHCLVKGQTLSGTGNLSGSTDPKLRPDGHILRNSPLRSAGGAVVQSRIDMDGELRPTSAPDIGVDQFLDSDADDLADQWEVAYAGNLTTLTSPTQDADNDGLVNGDEHASLTNPTVADTDGDGLSDGLEVNQHGTNPLVTDTDNDGMPDGWEATHGLSPLVADALADADGDRYPNIYEYAASTNPADLNSKPTPNFVVDGGGGGTHLTVSAAISAASLSSGEYQIIGIAPGTYSGWENVGTVTWPSSKPKFLVIGLQGADKTIFEGDGANEAWRMMNTIVLSSLTFRNNRLALHVNAPSSEVRIVDVLVRDNASQNGTTGLYVSAASKVHVIGSTFLNNPGPTGVAEQIYVDSGALEMTNTVVWGQSAGLMVAKATAATLTTNHCLVKGQTLSGTGNLSGTTDPRIRADAHLQRDSALRGAAAAVVQSRIDTDGELRPLNGRDIGVDQFNDVDADGLPDHWEIANFGNTTTLSGTADGDADGLDNAGEYEWGTNRLNPDTDGDNIPDGFETTHGMNPLVPNGDELFTDYNHDGLYDNTGLQIGYSPAQLDNDGDSVSNEQELLMCTDPFRADTDGDGVADNLDAFPLDPRRSSLSSDPQDVTPPVITLTAPWYAVAQ